jgi:hypothetical protein
VLSGASVSACRWLGRYGGRPFGDPAGHVLGGEPDLASTSVRGAMFEEVLCSATVSSGRSISAVRRAAALAEPTPPCSPPSSTVTTSWCRWASDTTALGTGSAHLGPTTVTSMPWSANRSAAAKPSSQSESTQISSTAGQTGFSLSVGSRSTSIPSTRRTAGSCSGTEPLG